MSERRAFLTALLVVLVTVFVRAAREPVQAGVDLRRIPYRIARWAGVDSAPIDPAVARQLGADAYLTRTYDDPARASLGLYVAYYLTQRPGVSIHSPLHCLPGTGWEPLEIGVEPIPGATGASIRRLLVRKNLDEAVVLYWYSVHGRPIANEVLSRFALFANALRLHGSDAALVRIVVPVQSTAAEADRTGLAFARDLVPSIARLWSTR